MTIKRPVRVAYEGTPGACVHRDKCLHDADDECIYLHNNLDTIAAALNAMQMREPNEDETKAAQEVTQRYRKQISDTPELLSLLYDIELMPEQIRLYVNALRMAAICEVYKRYYSLPPSPEQT